MKLGLLKETKNTEKRVLLIPHAVSELVEAGHEVFVESGAGEGSLISDSEYESIGANILPVSEKIFKNAEIILKVQPPLPVEYELYDRNHINISFLYLFGSPERALALMQRESIFLGMESFTDDMNYHPVLQSMNEISGILAVIHATTLLQKQNNALGILLPETTYSKGAVVSIIGAGKAGTTAALKALELGAHVNLFDHNADRLEKFYNEVKLNQNLNIFEFSRAIIREILIETDVLIGAAFRPGHKPEILISEKDINLMRKGTVVLDLTIEHGGCIETSRQSSLEEPYYFHNGIIHSCIANLPSVVSRTSSQALSHSVLSYIRQIADIGIEESFLNMPHIKNGLKLYHGKVVNPNLAQILESPLYDIEELLELKI